MNKIFSKFFLQLLHKTYGLLCSEADFRFRPLFPFYSQKTGNVSVHFPFFGNKMGGINRKSASEHTAHRSCATAVKIILRKSWKPYDSLRGVFHWKFPVFQYSRFELTCQFYVNHYLLLKINNIYQFIKHTQKMEKVVQNGETVSKLSM